MNVLSRSRHETPEALDPRRVERDLRRQLSLIDHRVPRSIELRVRDITTTITEVLPRARELGPASRDLFVLQRTADDYLPTALNTYLNLPRGAVVRDGKTADQVLIEQLDVLSAQLRQIKAAILRKDSDALVAHGRFLEDKFGKADPDSLPIPDTYRTTAPRPLRRAPATLQALARTNPMAWVSFGFGVFGIVGDIIPFVGGLTCAMVAIITGLVARSQIKRTGEGGSRLALFGIILGAAHIAVLALIAAIFGTVLIALLHTLFH